MIAQLKVESEFIGTFYLVASNKGLQGILWKRRMDVPVSANILDIDPAVAAVMSKTLIQLDEYFKAQRKDFDLPLELEGTEFQMKVWKELRKIPYGKTLSYRDIAKRIRNEKAVRAVGTANGRNPISIVIPCHRVIASNDKLAGYAGGLDKKEKLLKLEKVLLV